MISGRGGRPGGPQFDVDRTGPVREGAEALRQDPGGGSAGRPVGRLVVLQGFHEPGPGHRAEHFVVAHFRLQLGADVGHDPELPVPDRRSVGVVEQDEAAGGQFVVVVVDGAGGADERRGSRPVDGCRGPGAGPAPMTSAPRATAKGASREGAGISSRRSSLRHRAFRRVPKAVEKLRGNLVECVHIRRLRNAVAPIPAGSPPPARAGAANRPPAPA